MLLTNDGDLKNSILKYKYKKTYLVRAHGYNEGALINLKKGVKLDDGFAKLDSIKVVDLVTIRVITGMRSLLTWKK